VIKEEKRPDYQVVDFRLLRVPLQWSRNLVLRLPPLTTQSRGLPQEWRNFYSSWS